MEIIKTWQQVNEAYFLRDVSTNTAGLPIGIYTVEKDPRTHELYLKYMSECFTFDFKIYGMEKAFINRVLKSYESSTGNLGVLFNGVKGTGKTITAEIIANSIKQPIVLVGQYHPNLSDFLKGIQQNVTVFIDEYEKVYKNNVDEDDYDDSGSRKADSTLLSLMDGAFTNKYRKLFLLTTNSKWINSNMLNRPGRIRYVKDFDDLSMDSIIEIIDDRLIQKQFRQEILTFIKPLEIITVDIIKCIVDEVNIFNESPEVCCADLNLEFNDVKYKLICNKTQETIVEDIDSVHYNNFTNNKNWRSVRIYTKNQDIIRNEKAPDYLNKLYHINYLNNDGESKEYIAKFVEEDTIHKSFII